MFYVAGSCESAALQVSGSPASLPLPNPPILCYNTWFQMSEENVRPQSGGYDDRRNSFPRDKDAIGEGKIRKKGRRKVSYLTLNKIESVDYKDVPILRRFINDRGKILPSRQSGNTAKQQRMIARAIRRARELALLPFVVAEMAPERRDFGPRRERPPRD